MIEVVLSDGRVVKLPGDAMTEDEITQAVEEYLDKAAAPAPVAVAPEPSPCEPAPEPAPEPAVTPLLSRFRIEPYRNDDDETGALMNRLPEAVRENLRRSMLPATRFDQPTGDDRFRDNWHRRWSMRYWSR